MPTNPEPIDPRPCPRCGASMVRVPIVYGFPSHETLQAFDRGEIGLGGCVVGSESPVFECPVCHAELRVRVGEQVSPARVRHPHRTERLDRDGWIQCRHGRPPVPVTRNLAVHDAVVRELERRHRLLDERDLRADALGQVVPGSAPRVRRQQWLPPVIEVPPDEAQFSERGKSCVGAAPMDRLSRASVPGRVSRT